MHKPIKPSKIFLHVKTLDSVTLILKLYNKQVLSEASVYQK